METIFMLIGGAAGLAILGYIAIWVIAYLLFLFFKAM